MTGKKIKVRLNKTMKLKVQMMMLAFMENSFMKMMKTLKTMKINLMSKSLRNFSRNLEILKTNRKKTRKNKIKKNKEKIQTIILRITSIISDKSSLKTKRNKQNNPSQGPKWIIKSIDSRERSSEKRNGQLKVKSRADKDQPIVFWNMIFNSTLESSTHMK